MKAIREVDAETPIILDSGFYATAWAFKVLEPVLDDKTIYSFHMYEPYSFREDTWPAMDYELGTEKPSWKYWDAIEHGRIPGPGVYKANPLSSLLKAAIGGVLPAGEGPLGLGTE